MGSILGNTKGSYLFINLEKQQRQQPEYVKGILIFCFIIVLQFNILYHLLNAYFSILSNNAKNQFFCPSRAAKGP